MPFAVEFAPIAAKRFRKLETQHRRRIGRALEAAASDPRHHFERLSGIRAYKLRVGDWRVVADIDWEDQTIVVLTVGHRSVVYG